MTSSATVIGTGFTLPVTMNFTPNSNTITLTTSQPLSFSITLQAAGNGGLLLLFKPNSTNTPPTTVPPTTNVPPSTNVPPGNDSTSKGELVGYIDSWSMWQPVPYNLKPSDCDLSYYTQLNYAFFVINKSYEVDVYAYNDPELVSGLKSTKPGNAKMIVSVGGWNFSKSVGTEAGKGTDKLWRNAISSNTNRTILANSVKVCCSKYGFDGIDIDIEYPLLEDGSSQNMTLFMEKLYNTLKGSGLAISMACNVGDTNIDKYYQLKLLNKYVDKFYIMAYDMYCFDDGTGIANPHTPLNPVDSTHTWSISTGIKKFIDAGISPSKLSLGLALYSRCFTLRDTYKKGTSVLNLPCYTNIAPIGKYTNMKGYLSYSELQDVLNANKANIITQIDNTTQTVVSIDTKTNSYYGYDNETTLAAKVKYARSLGINSFFVWNVQQDINCSLVKPLARLILGK